VEHASPPAPASLDTALRLIAVVRRELGVTWTDLGVAPRAAAATFALGEPQLRELRLRRRGLLVVYVDRLVAERAERIAARRLGSRTRLDVVRGVRAWGEVVGDHVVSVRRLGEPAARGAAG
jgi:hypothetical protein